MMEQYPLIPKRAHIVHGTPVTPKRLLADLKGSSFCVSFAYPEQSRDVVPLLDPHGILVLDNGAFTIWNAKRKAAETGEPVKLPKRLRFSSLEEYRLAFWRWAEFHQSGCPNAVAVIPDVIEGTAEQNLMEASYALRAGYARYPERTMFIWHMDEPLSQLKLAARLFNFIGIGSCAEFDVTGTTEQRAAYMARLKHAGACLDWVRLNTGRSPWVHLMRGLGVYHKALRFASADSANVAMNHCRHRATHGEGRVRHLAGKVERKIADALHSQI